jgi:hypothetical protein
MTDEVISPIRLPIVIIDDKEYTIDDKLKEFRRVYRDSEDNLQIEFIPFFSSKGSELRSKMASASIVRLKQVL